MIVLCRRIKEFEDQLAEYQSELTRSQNENTSLRDRLDGGDHSQCLLSNTTSLLLTPSNYMNVKRAN